MTGSVMVNSPLGIGLRQLTGGVRARVNFGRVAARHDSTCPSRDYVIEPLESVECDDETVEACRELAPGVHPGAR